MSLLLDKHADANAKTQFGVTPLHFASVKGRDAIVRELLQRGADPNTSETKEGRTGLHEAAANKNEQVVQLLLSAEANIEASDTRGMTPLYHAADRGHESIVRILLREGASSNTASHDGWVPLHQASLNGFDEIVQILIDANAQVNLQSRFGQTPLHQAISARHASTVEILADAGADPSLLNCYGRSCKDLAEAYSFNVGLGPDRSSRDEKQSCLDRTIRDLISQLDIPLGEDDSIDLFNRLGHAFIFAGEDINAAICFETLISVPPPDDDDNEIIFSAYCDHCGQNIRNRRFVCRVCDDGDLCDNCHELYSNADIDLDLPRCRNHTFLEVPREEWHDFKWNVVLADGTTRQQWSKRMRKWRGADWNGRGKEEGQRLPMELFKRFKIGGARKNDDT